MANFDLKQISAEASLRHVEYHEILESTSRLAVDFLSDLLALSPSLVLTSNQTAGRGRSSNVWWATPGALTFTLVLDVNSLGIPQRQLSMTSLAVGVAVRQVLADLLPNRRTFIKWPNDVMVENQKICGILTEQHSVDGRSGLLIGVGINVNNSLADAPAEVRQRATSVFDLTGEQLGLSRLLINVLQSINGQMALLANSPASTLAETNAHNILHNQNVTLAVADRKICGTCFGVDNNGALLLDSGSGPVAFLAGTVLEWKTS